MALSVGALSLNIIEGVAIKKELLMQLKMRMPTAW